MHFFGVAGDVEYPFVLVDNGSASFPGSCEHSWGFGTLVWVRATLADLNNIRKTKCTATCSPSWSASLWSIGTC